MSKLDELKNDEYFASLFSKNNLSDDILNKNVERLYRIFKSRQLCANCNGLNMCKQLSKGERLSVIYDDVFIEEVEVCDYKRTILDKKEIVNAYVYCDVPEKLIDIDLNNINYTKEQEELYYLLAAILHKKTNKGLYIVGDLGVGKTYLSVALANSLVKNNEKVAFLKTSNFFNEMKSYIVNNSYMIERNIEKLKKVTYLFIDDIGAESVSEFVRDDILLNVLDYRLENGLITIFTSNLNKSDLLNHYTYDRKDNSNKMKAKRLLERIDILTNDYALLGQDKRRI